MKSVLLGATATVVALTIVVAILLAVGAFGLSDMIVILAFDVGVAASLWTAHAGAWRLGTWLFIVLLFALSCLLAWRTGAWSPAVAYFCLTIVVAASLLKPWGLCVVLVVCFASFAGAAFVRGTGTARDIVGAIIGAGAPMFAIAALSRFAVQRLESALALSRSAARGLEKEVVEHNAAQTALEGSMVKVRALLDAIPDGIVVLDDALEVVDCNASLLRMLGLPDREALVGKSTWDYIVPEDRALIAAEVDRARGVGVTGRITRVGVLTADGARFEVAARGALLRDAAGAPQGLLVDMRDITEQIAVEGRLRQAEKLEAVGQLAGGVAHDFNNILLSIEGYTDLALQSLSGSHPAAGLLAEVQKAAGRAGALVRQLLALSEDEPRRSAAIDLNALVESAMPILRRRVGDRMRIELRAAQGALFIAADPAQVELALANLCSNARDAMPAGGTVVIETGSEIVDAAGVVVHPGASRGAFAWVRVSDSGVGMSAEVTKHMYEPFFTTKRPSGGSGVGLASVYGIMRRHGGFIDCRSEPGKGSSFTLYFPATPSAPVPAAAVPAEPSAVVPALAAATGPDPGRAPRETILLVEDDDMVRTLADRVLRQGGYVVVTTADGEEALAAFTANPSSFDMALVDVVMPGMDGRTLAQALWATRPSLPVMFSSGYDFRILDEVPDPRKKVQVIQKPYRARDLLARVRSLLDMA